MLDCSDPSKLKNAISFIPTGPVWMVSRNKLHNKRINSRFSLLLKLVIIFKVYATWNNASMTLRSGSSNDPFTQSGASWDNDMYYYTNLPFEVQMRFPMYGTADINTGDANILVLTRPMLSFLLRHRAWNPVPLDGWRLISSGNYLGPLITDGNIDLYQKTFPRGTYIIDNNSAMYLFSDVMERQK